MKLSIITINYNNAEGLRKTLASVAAQTYRDIEYIVIDGASTDESVDVIRELESNLQSTMSNFQWLTEPDSGIYDAMNKGLRMAKGEYLYFLNSGDTLYGPDSLAQMIGAIDGSDFIVGRVDSILNGTTIGISPVYTEADYSLFQMYLHGINHQSVLIRRELQLQYPYDTSRRIGGDWRFFVQTIVLNGATVSNVGIVFARFDRSGVSSDGRALVEERLAILREILPKHIADDYLAVLPHYYEVIRLQWLLRHPFWYRVYRGWTTLGRKLIGSK